MVRSKDTNIAKKEHKITILFTQGNISNRTSKQSNNNGITETPNVWSKVLYFSPLTLIITT